MSSCTQSCTVLKENESPGKICNLMRCTLYTCTPPSSQKHHNPTNSSRALVEHSTICTLDQNSGLMVRMRANGASKIEAPDGRLRDRTGGEPDAVPFAGG